MAIKLTFCLQPTCWGASRSKEDTLTGAAWVKKEIKPAIINLSQPTAPWIRNIYKLGYKAWICEDENISQGEGMNQTGIQLHLSHTDEALASPNFCNWLRSFLRAALADWFWAPYLDSQRWIVSVCCQEESTALQPFSPLLSGFEESDLSSRDSLYMLRYCELKLWLQGYKAKNARKVPPRISKQRRE